MRERTRQSFCRLSFILFCVIPTLFVSAWILLARSSYYQNAVRASWERRLRQESGLVVTLESISHPYRGATLLHGVTFSDPETGRQVARVRLIEAAIRPLPKKPPSENSTENASSTSATEQLIVRLSQPEIDADHLPQVWEVLERRVLRGSVSLTLPAYIYASELAIHGKTASQTYLDVGCHFTPAQEEKRLVVEFRLAGLEKNESTEPAQMTAVRYLRDGRPTTRFRLNTSGAAFPCEVFAPYAPGLSRLGPRCRFQGILWAERTPQGWEGEAAGRLTQIDLDRLVSDQFPHKLSGVAQVVFNGAKIRRGRFIEAAGEFEGRGGVVSSTFLEAIEQHLYLTLAPEVRRHPHTRLRYRQLKFGFKLNENGLELAGRCDQLSAAASSSGAIIIDDQRVLLTDAGAQLRPMVGLVRALAPRSEIQAPATKETNSLLQIFPIPPLAPPREQIARPPDSNLRLRGERR